MTNSLKTLALVEHIFPSEANFLLVKMMKGSDAFNELRKRGVIVRDRSKQLHCEDCIRITIGTVEENDTLIKAIKEIQNETLVG